MKTKIKTLIILGIIFFLSCEKEKEDKINTLQASESEILIPAEGDTTSFIIETDAPSWNIENPATDWISIPVTSGESEKALISITVNSKTLENRSDTLTITAGNANPVYVTVSQIASDYLYTLKTNLPYQDFSFASGSISMKITSGAPKWELACEADWVELSQNTGAEGAFEITINVLANSETTKRSTTINLTGNGAPSTEIAITQNGAFPSYNTNPIDPDMTGMSSSAAEIASKIKIGWNIGNTMEATGGETSWGNPLITEELIKLVKANGFNAIRIPCSWDKHLESRITSKIRTSWLDRVKEVVQYCVDNDMYVLLNIHWDGGWLENNCTPDKKDFNNAKQKAFWEQIATHLRDFDEHLMFASANEPNVDNATQMAVLNSYHQTFVDAVRSTGGKNSYRVLVVQGPSTDIEKTNNLMNTMPTDEIEGRMMAEIHFYGPYQFTLMEEDANWGKVFYYWGKGYHSATSPERNATWGEEDFIDEMFSLMNKKFVIKGIPVILGEFGVMKRTSLTGDDLELHLAARAYYYKYLMQQAKINGLLPFYWDTGYIGDKTMTIFNRENYTVYDQQILDSLMVGINN